MPPADSNRAERPESWTIREEEIVRWAKLKSEPSVLAGNLPSDPGGEQG